MIRLPSAVLCFILAAVTSVDAQSSSSNTQEQKETQRSTETKQDAEQKAERRRRRQARKRKLEAETEKATGKVEQKEGSEEKEGAKDQTKKKQDAKKNVGDKKQSSKKKPAGKKSDPKVDKDRELTLENLFPDKSHFGPRASSTAFSADGRYGAWLYKTRAERRHGNDLWVYDFRAKTKTRVTNVVMMSEFQKSARKVRDDRLAKATKETGGKDEKKKSDDSKDQKSKKQELSDDDILRKVMDVSDKDADDSDAPRYSGISSFTWHPEKNALLFSSEGDVYQIADVGKPKPVRLTKTQSRESQVRWLPDGSGYTFSAADVVYRVRFGQHLVEQLNPALESGLTLSSYSLSPDGKRLVLTARSGSRPTGTRTVDYIRYRDRFAQAAKVPRTVSDDKTEAVDQRVYLFDLEKLQTEESELVQVFKVSIDEPRDVLSSPEWAPDSSRVTFGFFDQKNSEMQILLATFPSGDGAEPEKSDKDAKANDTEKNAARVVYRFAHFGGPNTPRMVSPEFAWDSRQIVFVSEQSGFRHVHLLDPLYESVRQLTNGHFEVYPQGLSKDHRVLFARATKEASSREMVYAIDLDSGEMRKISKQPGTYSSVAVSNDGRRMLGSYETYGRLRELVRQDGDDFDTLTDSHSELARHFTKPRPQFFEYTNRHGHTIKGMMFKPAGWKKTQKHPLLIYVYGGPLGTRKSVVDGSYSSSGYFFNSYMAQKHGYVTVVIDPRGQSGYGGVFEKANYEQVGKPQVEDLTDGVRYLTKAFNIDDKRVGIYGWSFGGFQTQMCLYTAPEVFQVGIAGAGPTEWENYNSWYATGTIGPSGTDKPDQKKYSLRPLAKNLKGKLLLIHGIEDTNVLFQDTVAIYRELLQAGKETHVELFLDPTGSHGLGGDVKRLNRYRKYEEFLLRTLGEG